MSADNYDDLDDLLDDSELQDKIFAKSPAAAKEQTEPPKQPQPKQPQQPQHKVTAENEAQTESSTTNNSTPQEPTRKDSDLPKELEDLLNISSDDPQAQEALKTLLAGLSVDEAAETNENTTESGEPKTFEDTISATMDRLNQSKKTGPGGSELDEAGLMEKLLQDMQKSIAQDGSSEGAGGLDGLLSTLLGELSSKEVLYDPLKELHTGYPDWFAKNKDSLAKDELERLQRQQSIVASIIVKFEDPKYSDSDRAARDYITERMVEMQDTGAPPQELVGDVAGGAFPGFPGMGSSAAPDLPSDCATQ